MNKLVETLLILIPTSLIVFFAGIFLGGEIWAKGKIVLGDILKFFGWANKSIRKLSVKSEYEGTINSIIQDYNKNFESPVLPNCKIQWVSAENHQNILKENEAIICLSFDKKDHDLNFYNATLNFVQTALVAKAKDYLKKHSSRAIDLLTTHIILRNNRRQALTVFRKKLNEFDNETRSEFETLAPTNDRGLFLNLLLPELHYYGELIDTLPPSSEFNIEAEELLIWFKELATREFDDRTKLKYASKNFKVGVILVGKDETWENQGAAAYTKWADYYASENFSSVYILARGNNGYERATAITKILTNSKGFDQINRNPKIKCFSADGSEYVVTCYSLRPNRATIAYLAWESLREYHLKNAPIPAIVDSVQKETIVVSVFGLKFEISNEFLSENRISDARRVFRVEDEVFLNIVEFDSDKEHIILSNKGSVSDPKHFIDAILSQSRVYQCKIEKIQTDRQGLQVGIQVSTGELNHWIFLPKYNVTSSRFLNLSSKFEIGTNIAVRIEKYNSASSRFIGLLATLNSPWESDSIKSIQPNDVLDATVKQINEFSVICEIEEGLECRFSRQEISWQQNECDTSRFKVDETVRVKLISIDYEKRRIEVSVKRVSKTPELQYYDDNFNQIVQVEIIQLVPDKGIVVKYPEGSNTGFIPWFEVAYAPIGKMENLFKKGDTINAIIYDFDANKNRLKFSIKRQYSHQFDNFIAMRFKNLTFSGRVVQYFENSAQIEIIHGGITVQAFILRKFISRYAFIQRDDLPYYLPIGKTFQFIIADVDNDRKGISLTRIEYLKQIAPPNYGDKIDAAYVKENHVKGYIYSNTVDGWINLPERHIPLGSQIEVLPVSHSSGEFELLL